MVNILHSIWVYFETHPGRDFLVYYIFMVMIDQMPAPGGNAFYKWFFGVTHVLSAQLVRGTKGVTGQLASPQVKNG